jgi:hypothetical protein
MIKTSTNGEGLKFQLLPFKIEESVIVKVFASELHTDLFGIKNNTLFFIRYKNSDENIEIQIPESIEENEGLIVAIDWALHRAQSTPDLNIDTTYELFQNKSNVIRILSTFVNNFRKEILKKELENGN